MALSSEDNFFFCGKNYIEARCSDSQNTENYLESGDSEGTMLDGHFK